MVLYGQCGFGGLLISISVCHVGSLGGNCVVYDFRFYFAISASYSIVWFLFVVSIYQPLSLPPDLPPPLSLSLSLPPSLSYFTVKMLIASSPIHVPMHQMLYRVHVHIYMYVQLILYTLHHSTGSICYLKSLFHVS